MIIELPQVGESVTEGVIGKWLKSVGDRVERFDPLVEVVTDKVNMEMPSPVTGTLTALLVDEGETIPMGTPIAEVAVEGETADEVAPSAPSAPPAESSPVNRIGTLLKDVAPVGPTGSGGPISSDGPARSDHGRRRYTPAVLRLAEERGVDLEMVQGTGIGGRVTLKDVRGFIERAEQTAAPPETPSTPAPLVADEERVPLSPVRRMIAANMVKSASEIPQAWTLVEADVTGLVARRQAVRADFQQREGINITYLPFVMKAVAESLKENPAAELILGWRRDHLQATDQHRDRGRRAGRPCRSSRTRRGYAQHRGSCQEDRLSRRSSEARQARPGRRPGRHVSRSTTPGRWDRS